MAERRDYDSLRSTAEGLFIEQGLTGRDIANALNVSEVTVSRWKAEDDWESKRDFIKLTPIRIRAKLMEEAERVLKGEEGTIKADAVLKLIAAADRLTTRITPATVYAVLTACCTHIATVEPKFAMQMAKYHRIYLQHIIESEG